MTDHPESSSGRWYSPAIITSWIGNGCGVNRAPPHYRLPRLDPAARSSPAPAFLSRSHALFFGLRQPRRTA